MCSKEKVLKKELTISAVMITLNAERFIRGSLESIKDWVDEIIIVDGFSTDKTIEIANNYTDKIFQDNSDPNIRFNIGFDKATSDWILIFCATERIPLSLKNEILGAIITNEYVGYRVPKKNYVCIDFFEEKPGSIGLFRKGLWRFSGIGGHEPIRVKGKVGCLKNFKVHWSSLSIEMSINKMNQYTSHDAKIVFAGYPDAFWWRRPVYKVNLFNLIYRPIAGFYVHYIYGKHYRLGLHGFIESVLGAFTFFVEMAKLWELQYKNEHNIKDESLPLD